MHFSSAPRPVNSAADDDDDDIAKNPTFISEEIAAAKTKSDAMSAYWGDLRRGRETEMISI